ncbi:unnamed protein product [Mytilus edulis]|uniref:Endonuclease/exonuclease/phosphatase domain-containing protein n=1 Tax=Mytilus edulis TaxID=6550 RepID=A0A8S3U8P7_MYTED|nr:unnamed protein product [Mytilus edulis]
MTDWQEQYVGNLHPKYKNLTRYASRDKDMNSKLGCNVNAIYSPSPKVKVANMLLSNLAVVITTSFVLVQCHDCKDYDLSASDQSLIDMMKHYLHTSRKEQGPSTGKQGASGVTYVRWGKKECSRAGELVYTGQAGGNQHTSKGGGVNYLCLQTTLKMENQSKVEVPCAVCYQRKRSTVLMIPGRKTCYKGWTFEYTGYLMSDYKDYSYKDYVCVDKDAEPVDNKTSDENGALFYVISTNCGSLRCPPYKNGVSVKCVVSECVRYYNLHILGLAETHLTGNTGINIDGYTWFGLNRKEIHIRAKTGSGGVGILIRNDVRDEFNINIVEDNTDGIIWVKFEDKNFAHNCFYVCVIYLPPENSTRAVNIHEFFDILMTNIYTIPQGKPFYICGDWNSRCSDLPDSIEGIDKLPQRNVVDFQHNGYGNIFCDFLTDVNCCILNGRKTLHNDFTFVSTRGMSVVDYCVLPYEHLDNFNNFNVIRTSSIVEQINALGKYDLKKAMPDHSLLTWDFTLNFDSNCCINTQTRGTSETKKKYDTRNLPEDWLCQESTIAEIDNAICFLENSIADQSNIDNMYENFVKIVKTEMCNKLPAKNIVLSNGFNINKRRRCKKEWWNEELTLLWNEVCKAEKVWIKCKIKRNKRELRHIFVNKRRIFDKAVQSSKRKYWYSLQEDLIKSCDNPKEFWRKIGKIGVGSERRSFIPMEVKLSDESVSCDKNVVLDKWKCEFSNMLNRNNLNNVEYIHSNENVYDDYLDSFISYEEVYNVLLSSKNGKSPGCDEITVELYKNQTALLALTRIFNICFDSGKIPALWSKGIITPIPKSSTADPRDPMAYRGITLAPVITLV